MSKMVTIARPYAKAALEFAIQHQDVAHWQSMLTFSAEVSRNRLIAKMLAGTTAPEQLARIFITICGDELDTFGKNLIRLIAKNRRLAVLPDVLEQFILQRAMQEKTLKVDVISCSTLKEEQLTKISAAIEQRLSCRVKLNCKLDKSIVAGIIIYAGDMVIDGSVRGRLERLAGVLQT